MGKAIVYFKSGNSTEIYFELLKEEEIAKRMVDGKLEVVEYSGVIIDWEGVECVKFIR